ncbi:hypothetical protein AB0395_45585 [Streptosporangium sp. NPDC051023]|uniref:hypothetical protein n=1 Tax=Streptosporangium sp. NPDC051023 TaxID=3155410 RepID=UPI00344F385A
MPEIPATALRAAEAAIRQQVRLNLEERALAATAEGRPIALSGTEAEQVARAALEALADKQARFGDAQFIDQLPLDTQVEVVDETGVSRA